MHNLTSAQVKNAALKEKPWKLTDGGGLYLHVFPTGSKRWKYDYRYYGKGRTLSLGVLPHVSLKQAREKHLEARTKLSNGIDPSAEKKANKLSAQLNADNTFESIAMEWFEIKAINKSEGHRKRTLRALQRDLFPEIGRKPVSEIKASELLHALRKIEDRGAIETARRTKQTAGQVFRFAIATNRAETDPSRDLEGALKIPTKSHRAALTEVKDVANLLKAIDSYRGSHVVCAALKLSPLLFQRPGEIRHMEWVEIDWKKKQWAIPAEKMKMRQPHIVPLSSQSLVILSELHKRTGDGKYVFPSPRGRSRCICDNAVRTALRTLGYENETMTPHGFRAIARTLLDEELGYRVDWIEQQLAHTVRDPNGRAYNRTKHLVARAEMMQAWANYLDKLKQI